MFDRCKKHHDKRNPVVKIAAGIRYPQTQSYELCICPLLYYQEHIMYDMTAVFGEIL
jgi:hypothetical protein